MADTIDSLRQDLTEMSKQLNEAKTNIHSLADSGGHLKVLADSFTTARQSIELTNSAAGETIKKLLELNHIDQSGVTGAISGLAQAMLGSKNSANAYSSMISSLSSVLGTVSPEFAQLFKTIGADLPAAFDNLTGTTKEFTKDIIELGSTYGLSFDNITSKTLDYQDAIKLAINYTFENDIAIRKAASTLAEYGISIDEITSRFNVAGHEQNLLSEGFLLASETGLSSNEVFKKMAEASRQMGYSIDNAGKPIVAMANIARATGLPISDIGDKVFKTASEFARLGLTVDAMEPVVRRFADVLGPSFKGLAIDETTKLFDNLKSKVNSTEAAFIAMRGGLAGPGAGVAQAQLAFEDAFKNPIEIVKSLTATLSSVTGGKIIKFEEARANPELSNQFKIQRDLLAQLTGNTDPQSQRTLMSILADLQTGRQLTSTQDKTLHDSLKSGQQKQDEAANIQQQLTRITIGLNTESNLLMGNFLTKILPPQVQGETARKVGTFAQSEYEKALKSAQNIGNIATEFAKGNGLNFTDIGSKISGAIASQMPGPDLSEAPKFRATINSLPNQVNSTTGQVATTSQIVTQNGQGPTNITITFAASDPLMQALANAARASIRQTNGGH